MAARFYAPLLVSGLEDMDKGIIDIHVTSDCLENKNGEVKWIVLDTEGHMLCECNKAIEIPALKNTYIQTLDLGEYIEKYGKQNIITILELTVDGKTVSNNAVFFARPKHIELVEPSITFNTMDNGNGTFKVELSAKKPALWAWLEIEDVDAQFDDNFIHIMHGRVYTVLVIPENSIEAETINKKIKVRSLIDTYNVY